MSEYTDRVLAKFPNVSAAIRKALAEALAAADKAQGGTPPLRTDIPREQMHAKASEGSAVAELDREAGRFILLSHGRLTHDQARRSALEASPELRKRVRDSAPAALRMELADVLVSGVVTSTPPDIAVADRAQARAERDGITLAAAQALVLADDPRLRASYERRFMASR